LAFGFLRTSPFVRINFSKEALPTTFYSIQSLKEKSRKRAESLKIDVIRKENDL